MVFLLSGGSLKLCSRLLTPEVDQERRNKSPDSTDVQQETGGFVGHELNASSSVSNECALSQPYTYRLLGGGIYVNFSAMGYEKSVYPWRALLTPHVSS